LKPSSAPLHNFNPKQNTFLSVPELRNLLSFGEMALGKFEPNNTSIIHLIGGTV